MIKTLQSITAGYSLLCLHEIHASTENQFTIKLDIIILEMDLTEL